MFGTKILLSSQVPNPYQSKIFGEGWYGDFETVFERRTLDHIPGAVTVFTGLLFQIIKMIMLVV